MVMIGIDPHKGSHTAVVIDEDERVVDERGNRLRMAVVETAEGRMVSRLEILHESDVVERLLTELRDLHLGSDIEPAADEEWPAGRPPVVQSSKNKVRHRGRAVARVARDGGFAQYRLLAVPVLLSVGGTEASCPEGGYLRLRSDDKEEQMPLFMDVHTMDSIDPEALAGAHERDLEVQGRHGVNYLQYWFSPEAGKVYCLVEAPSAEAAEAVHRDSHGLLADEIVAVIEGH